MEKLSESHHDNQYISTKQVQLPSNRDTLNLMKDIISNINLSYPLPSDTVAMVMSGVIQIEDETSKCMKVEYLQDKIIFKLSESLNTKIAEIIENSKIINEDHMDPCFLIHQVNLIGRIASLILPSGPSMKLIETTQLFLPRRSRFLHSVI